MPEEKRSLKVFLCHASGDKPVVRQLYKNLCMEGIDAWLDSEKLVPGQKWQLEIPKAVRSSDIVVVCLSEGSVNKEGYVKKEIEFALDIANEQPEGSIFIIPARLEDCPVPERLSNYQWVNLFESHGYNRLIDAFKLRALQIGTKPPGRKGLSSLLHPADQVTFEDFARKTGTGDLLETEVEMPVEAASRPRQRSKVRFMIEVIGLVASILGIITFITGIENIGKFFRPVIATSQTDIFPPSFTPAQTSVPETTSTEAFQPVGPVTLTPEPHILVYPPADDKDILYDAFDTNSNLWISYYPGRVASVEKGHLRVVSYESGYVSVGSCSGCGNYSENFYYQVDLKLSKFKNVPYGLIFCSTENNNYYVFFINHNTFQYSLYKLNNDNWLTLIDYTPSDQIYGHPHTNTMSVSFEQGFMELFINGIKVDSYVDSDPLTGGAIGLIIGDVGAELYGDNVFAYLR